jgi:hypothetical protein
MSRARILAAVTIALAAGAAAAPEASASETYSCYCEGYCGNGGVGANPGKLMSGMSESVLEDYFGVTGSGLSTQTGWACMAESQSYACEGASATHSASSALQAYGRDTPEVCAIGEVEVIEQPAEPAPEVPPVQRPRRPYPPRRGQ